jgi:glutathione S-transferase
MNSNALKLYQSNSSPNSRRVRIFIAEKGVTVPTIAVDLGKGEQHADAYRAINPRRVVPTLVLSDGTAIGEVPAIQRYLEDAFPERPLFGVDAVEKALVTMWERRIEHEGFASVMEAIRNVLPGLQARAIAGPHDYEQIPALVERSKQRVANFYTDLEARLSEVRFVAGERYSVADITALVTVDFATKAIDMPVPEGNANTRRWYAEVSGRASTGA